MNRQDLKNYIYSKKWIEKQIENYKEQRILAEGLTQNIDGMPKPKNKTSYKLEELMDKYNDIINILIKDQEKQNEIILQLREVEQPYRNILQNKYVLGKSLEEISVEIGYSYDRTCKMHGTALDKFDNIEKNKSGQ
jgi:hypothetical protein